MRGRSAQTQMNTQLCCTVDAERGNVVRTEIVTCLGSCPLCVFYIERPPRLKALSDHMCAQIRR